MDDAKRWPGKKIWLKDARPALAEKLDDFFRHGPRDRPLRVLEAGCGNGDVTDLLYDRLMHHSAPGTRLYALDIDPEKLREADRFLKRVDCDGVHCLIGDFYDIPVPATCLDYLIALNITFWADRPRLFREAYRVLKPEGKMLVYDLIPAAKHEPRPRMTLALPREQLAASGGGIRGDDEGPSPSSS